MRHDIPDTALVVLATCNYGKNSIFYRQHVLPSGCPELPYCPFQGPIEDQPDVPLTIHPFSHFLQFTWRDAQAYQRPLLCLGYVPHSTRLFLDDLEVCFRCWGRYCCRAFLLVHLVVMFSPISTALSWAKMKPLQPCSLLSSTHRML